MASLSSLLRLMRPINCVMMGLAVLVGAALAPPTPLPQDGWLLLLNAFLTAFALTGSAMAVNDYYDRDIDAANEPNRPIPSGAVSPSEALVLFVFLSALGLTTALACSSSCLAAAVFAWVVMSLYSTKGKKTGLPGNMLVSTCVSLPFVYGPLALGGIIPLQSVLFACMAFLSNTAREVVKGITDIQGDSAAGVRTIAVSRGARAAAVLSTALNMGAVALSILPWKTGQVSILYVPFIAVSDAGFLTSSTFLLLNPEKSRARSVKNLMLAWMLLSLIGFFAGSLR